MVSLMVGIALASPDFGQARLRSIRELSVHDVRTGVTGTDIIIYVGADQQDIIKNLTDAHVLIKDRSFEAIAVRESAASIDMVEIVMHCDERVRPENLGELVQ